MAPFASRARVFLGLPASRPGWSADAELPLAREVVPVISGIAWWPCRWARSRADGDGAGDRGPASRHYEVALVGGVDSYMHVDTLERLDDDGPLHDDHDSHSSFVPAEGRGSSP